MELLIHRGVMIIHRSYKVELDPNNKQKTAFIKHCGVARWVYNWSITRRSEEYKKTGKSPSWEKLHHELVILKHLKVEDGGLPWLSEVSKCVAQNALKNNDAAYKRFFKNCRENKAKKGYPKYKSRKMGFGTFKLQGSIVVSSSSIKLPVIGSIRLKQRNYIPVGRKPENVKILSATVSEKAGHWFVSVATEEMVLDVDPQSVKTKPVVGIDVGISSLATSSDGSVYQNPRALRKSSNKLRFLQKSQNRKILGSANWKKAVQRVRRQYYKVSCVRNDALHKATSKIAQKYSTIVVEDLNIVGMMKNHCLAQAVADASMAEFLRQIKYKAEWNGVTVLVADRWFPSSKTCSQCGKVKHDLKLSDRVFKCEHCGFVIDRDLNAAINLKSLEVSLRLKAAGSAVSPVERAALAGHISDQRNCSQ